jgi:hypothetical protein
MGEPQSHLPDYEVAGAIFGIVLTSQNRLIAIPCFGSLREALTEYSLRADITMHRALKSKPRFALRVEAMWPAPGFVDTGLS